MLRVVGLRLALSVGIVLLVVFVLFVLSRMLSGDPATMALGPRATQEMREAFAVEMGLDRSVPVQFVAYVRGLLSGDLGADFLSGRPVLVMIGETLPHTIILAVTSISWAVALGVLVGVQSALHPRGWFDRVTALTSVALIALPPFVIGIYILILGAIMLDWFPASGLGEGPVDYLHHLVLPSITVGSAWVGYIARIVRAALVEELGSPYVRTATAFGLPRRRIAMRQCLRIAILPVITLIAGGIGFLLSSSVFAEVIFSRPGMGTMIYDAVLTRNYAVAQGGVLAATIMFVALTLAADLTITALDPRTRLQGFR
jgi:peptide/nickel transport system permease protein